LPKRSLMIAVVLVAVVIILSVGWAFMNRPDTEAAEEQTGDAAQNLPPGEGVIQQDNGPGEDQAKKDAVVESALATVPARMEVLGYYTVDFPGDDLAAASYARHNDLIDLLVPFRYRLRADGRLQCGGFDAVNLAERYRGQAMALVHNFGRTGFDGDVVGTVLADARVRERALGNLVQTVKEGGYVGLNLDLEQIPPRFRDYYTEFVADLHGLLKSQGLLLYVVVPGKTHDERRNTWSGAFDYAALAQNCDALVIMAYDEHWAGGSAGPIASLGWVRAVAAYAVQKAGADKILLGIAAYGYDWGDGPMAEMISASEAVRRAARTGAEINWDAAVASPKYRYWRDGVRHQVYFENKHSTIPKLDLVRELGLRGIAIWRLGYEDPGIWAEIAARR